MCGHVIKHFGFLGKNEVIFLVMLNGFLEKEMNLIEGGEQGRTQCREKWILNYDPGKFSQKYNVHQLHVVFKHCES